MKKERNWARIQFFRAQSSERSEGVSTEKLGFEPVIIAIFFAFSLWLMFHTFGYDARSHTILIASKLWSDFGSHIPLIRSFSMGNNWPPEYPLFPGEPIRYHFLFYAFVGLLEKAGLPIDWALNFPSAIGLTLLLWGVWTLAIQLLKNKAVAALSILFFLFNGSLAFIKFFLKQPLTLRDFPAFGPWDGGMITAFWNLNIYTNQRHLAWAFAIGVWFLVWITRTKKPTIVSAILWGILIGVLPSLHQPMLLVFAIFLVWYFLAFPRLRIPLCIVGAASGALIIPQLLTIPKTEAFSWYPGYLMHDARSFTKLLSFWFQNLGLHAILIPAGFFFLPSRAKKLLFPIIVLFTMGNLFKFSPEVAANHKFFNFALILGVIMSASVVVSLRNYVIISVLAVLLTLSGMIDFLVVASDTKGALADVGNNPAATWIASNTPREAIFLNSSFLYHPAGLAGRKVFLGWPYFAWSAGYDTYKRNDEMKTMYESKDPAVFCPLLAKYNISFVTVENTKNDPNLPKIDPAYFRSLAAPAFVDEKTSLAIYTTASLCGRPAP